MTKKKTAPAGNVTPNPQADSSMADFLSGLDLSGYEVGSRLTLNIWEPKEGEIRAFTYEGREERSGEIEGKMTTFDVHYGKDLKTGDDFSFIGGGLFSFTIDDRKVEKGTPIIARYMGMEEIEDNKRAKQWEIRILNRK